jgi:competence protein ComGC
VEESTLGWCTSDNTQVYVGVLIALNATIVVLSLVQSYECRRITTEYSESLWISASIAITTQAWIISLPLIILLEDNPRNYFLVRSGTILCTTLPVLLLIFVPKMIYLYEALGDKKESKLIMKQQQEEYEKNKNKNDNIDSSNNKATTHAVVQRKNEPKGTIGIRIVQFVYLDSDEVDELEEAVDKAEQRNNKLRNTMDRLKENLEERRYTRTYPFDSQNHSISGSTSNTASNGTILAARPENIRHSKHTVRRDTYHE